MIAGNLDALSLATLPGALLTILQRPELGLAALRAAADGRYQPADAEWFYSISRVMTEPQAQRHMEYHHEFLDIQVLLSGEEMIGYDVRDADGLAASERKPDLFILDVPLIENQI